VSTNHASETRSQPEFAGTFTPLRQRSNITLGRGKRPILPFCKPPRTKPAAQITIFIAISLISDTEQIAFSKVLPDKIEARRVGLEPTTNGLTVALRSAWSRRPFEVSAPFVSCPIVDFSVLAAELVTGVTVLLLWWELDDLKPVDLEGFHYLYESVEGHGLCYES